MKRTHMPKRSIRHERRGPDRPAIGNWKACPSCSGGMLLFTEQYRARNSPSSSALGMPAWVCDKCSNVTFVRAEHQPSVLRETARNLRAAARRTLMKTRFVKKRADRALKKSVARKRRG